ncbi:MAG: glucokinase [Acidobacteriaceae bacterium]
MSRVLAGDVGGTTSRLAAFDVAEGRLTLSAQRDYRNRDFASLDLIIADFLARVPGTFELAALAVAGPVVNNTVSGTNLPWVVAADVIASAHGILEVVLLNDLLALAYGIHELSPADLEVLQAGDESLRGNCAVLAAGTGLGEAGFLQSEAGFTPFPSEGGHGDFGPNGETQAELYLYLHKRFGHVSSERLLAGSGIENIYSFLRDSGRFDEPKELADELAQAPDLPSAISGHALAGRYAICIETLILFSAILGAEAGNLALRLFATGGVYIGGGIAPKIAPFLRKPILLEAFRNKGRLCTLLERIPVRLILNQHTGLIGAAAFGRDHSAAGRRGASV